MFTVDLTDNYLSRAVPTTTTTQLEVIQQQLHQQIEIRSDCFNLECEGVAAKVTRHEAAAALGKLSRWISAVKSDVNFVSNWNVSVSHFPQYRTLLFVYWTTQGQDSQIWVTLGSYYMQILDWHLILVNRHVSISDMKSMLPFFIFFLLTILIFFCHRLDQWAE